MLRLMMDRQLAQAMIEDYSLAAIHVRDGMRRRYSADSIPELYSPFVSWQKENQALIDAGVLPRAPRSFVGPGGL